MAGKKDRKLPIVSVFASEPKDELEERQREWHLPIETKARILHFHESAHPRTIGIIRGLRPGGETASISSPTRMELRDDKSRFQMTMSPTFTVD